MPTLLLLSVAISSYPLWTLPAPSFPPIATYTSQIMPYFELGWAQKWVQSTGVNPFVETYCPWHTCHRRNFATRSPSNCTEAGTVHGLTTRLLDETTNGLRGEVGAGTADRGAEAGRRDSKSRSRVATMPFSLLDLTAKHHRIRDLPEFSGAPFFPNFLTDRQNSARTWYHWYHPPYKAQPKGVQTPYRHVQCHERCCLRTPR